MNNWAAKNIPSQKGRTVIVTGTGGIGFQDALALAGAGARVIIAGRSVKKGNEAVLKIRELTPDSDVSFEVLDLANIKLIKNFGVRMRSHLNRLDILINNAAVMAPPRRRVTSDGFELQIGTNYIGPFILTSELLPILKKTQNSRIVTLSSIAAPPGPA